MYVGRRNKDEVLNFIDKNESKFFKIWNESGSINYVMSKEEVRQYVLTSYNFNIIEWH